MNKKYVVRRSAEERGQIERLLRSGRAHARKLLYGRMQSFKDAKGRFGPKRVRVGSAERLSRLLMAFTIALSWLTLMGLQGDVLPEDLRAAVSTWGRASAISLVLSLLEKPGNPPLRCLPQTSGPMGRWVCVSGGHLRLSGVST
jgi:hypothetical protein